MDLTSSSINFFASMTLVGDIIFILLLGSFLLEVFTKKQRCPVLSFVSRHALLLMFIVALTAMGGSLFFSEVLGWAPCRDCWFQRIFLYPQVILLGIALWKHDRRIAPYILALCIIGALISISHYAGQIAATLWPAPIDPLIPCDASGVSCAQVYTFSFGYITIPVMALTASLLNALGSVVVLWRERKESVG